MRVPDVFDRMDAEDQDPEERVVKCKRCGSTDVRWRMQTGKWTLFSMAPGVEHKCPRVSAADDFKKAPRD